MKKTIKEKIAELKSMTEDIKKLNDCEAYMSWIFLVPDEADEEDYHDIAADKEDYNEAVERYNHLMNIYKN